MPRVKWRLSNILGVLARKSAEQVLQSTETQFETLADAIPQLCWIAEPDGHIFWYNKRWYEYTGTTPDQMRGWGWQSVHDPEVLPRVLDRWQNSLATGEPLDMVFPLRGGDGVFRPFLTRVMPVKDAEGKITRWFGTNTDIGEQKEIEAELRDSQQRLQLALEVADLGEWERDLQGNRAFRSLRHAQIFGYSNTDQEWTFSKFIDHILPHYRGQVIERLRASENAGAVIDFEAPILRADGEVRWIWVRSKTDPDHSGKPARAFGVVLDITDRKRAEEALLRSEKLASVGRVAATIAHEINNPLEAVTNLLFLAQADPAMSESTRQYLEIADTELKRVAHIARQSLGFYRDFNAPTVTSVSGVMESVVNLMKSKIGAKNAVIQMDLDSEVEIMAVAGEIRQVLSNLVGNSLDAIASGGKIRLRVSRGHDPRSGGNLVRITVADNGQGIKPSATPHIFDPFFTTKGSVGTGLGLWVAKQIIDKHNGSIRMKSRTDGPCKGTTFSIVLPADGAPAAESQQSASGQPQP